MKKLILAFVALALAGATVPTAKAGDCEWATVGKVLTGVMAASVITRAVEPAPVYYPAAYAYRAPAYSYCPPPPPPVVCAPVRPVMVYRAPVYVTPPPAVGFYYRFGGGHGHGHHRHGHW